MASSRQRMTQKCDSCAKVLEPRQPRASSTELVCLHVFTYYRVGSVQRLQEL